MSGLNVDDLESLIVDGANQAYDLKETELGDLMHRGERLTMLNAIDYHWRRHLTDLDILRHMNNGRYLSLADLGRWDLVVRIGVFARTQQLGWIPLLSQASATFRKSLVLGQRFELQTRMIGTDDRAVLMEQRFVSGGEIYMQLITRTRFVKRSGGVVTMDELHNKLGTLPDEIPEWVHQWAESSRLVSAREKLPSDWK